MKLNINENVWVKLTEHGQSVLNEHYHQTEVGVQEMLIENSSKFRAPRHKTERGFTRFHLWEFMHIFGPKMYNGSKQCIEKNVIMDDEGCKLFEVEEILES